MLKRVDDLIEKLLPNITEYVRLVELKQQLEDYVTKAAFEILTDKERYLYENYKDYVIYQENFSMFGEYNFRNSKGEEFENTLIAMDNYWNYSKRQLNLKGKSIPILIKREEGLSNLPDHMKDTIFNLCEEARRIEGLFLERIKKIEELLKNPLLTLTILKQHFPELYTLYKTL